MSYGVTITYFTKESNGMITPHTSHISGSKTRVFDAINEILKDGDFIDITVIIRKSKEGGIKQ